MSDTSPISNLIQVDQLNLLKGMFGNIYIPPYVDYEISGLESFKIDLYTYKNSDWITIKSPTNDFQVQEISKYVDKGESEAIVLAHEMNSELLIIDERLGSAVATEKYGLKTIGLLGVLILCKRKELINEVKPIIDELRKTAGFWISANLYFQILKETEEIN